LVRSAFGQTAKYGLGLIIFDPSGMTAKAWLEKGGAIDGAVGWSAMGSHQLQIQADYLFFEAPIAREKKIAPGWAFWYSQINFYARFFV
jgi:hypothetical protein